MSQKTYTKEEKRILKCVLSRRWRKNNLERSKQTNKEYRVKNSEKLKEKDREKGRKKQAALVASPEYKAKKLAKETALKNKHESPEWKEHLRILNNKHSAAWYANHKQLAWKRGNLCKRKKQKTDPGARIEKNLRGRIQQMFSRGNINKDKKFREYLGCSPIQLRDHLEVQFQDGMTWNNYSRSSGASPYWVIDHFIPCARYNLADIIHQLECFGYKNLVPLWDSQNSAKQDFLGQFVEVMD